MGPGVDSPQSLWIPWSGAWGKVTALPLGLQHHVNQGAAQSCGCALLTKWGCICPKPWSCVPKENKPCTRYFSSFQENFDLPRVCLPALSVPKKLGGDISLEKNRTETLGKFWDSGFGMQMMETSLWHLNRTLEPRLKHCRSTPECCTII